MKNKVSVTYEEILELRRGLRYNSDFPNILCYDQFADNSGYELLLGLQTFTASHMMTNVDDITHFEASIKSHCNKVDSPAMLILPTHDYSDVNSWVVSTTNSLYYIQPMDGKEYVLHSILGKMNHNLTFGSGQTVKFVLWQTACDHECPEVGSTATPFADVMYNPAGSVFTGWYKVFPVAGTNQKPNIWYHFTDNDHDYTVTEFVFENIDDFLEQSVYAYQGDTIRLTYKYKEFGAYLSLRSSMNERIEIYTNDNQPLENPVGATTKSVISCVLLHYDEF